MVPVETCCVCDTADADVIARGYDFEYATSPDEFSACRCRACRELVKRAQYLAGLKGYVTNIKTDIMDGDCVVAAYHDLYLVERSFWTTKTDLAAQCSTGCAIASRPTSPSCSPLAVPRGTGRTGQSINKIVKTYGRCGPPRSPSAASRSPPRPNKSWTTSPAVVTKPMRLRQISRSDDSPEPGPVTVLGVDETLARRSHRASRRVDPTNGYGAFRR